MEGLILSKIACVILNYNDAERTICLAQRIVDYKTIDFVIIVDNCSTDDSYIELKELKSPKLILIRSDKNGGYGFGNNLGIRKAFELKVDYVIISNPDVEFTEKCVIKLLYSMEKNKRCAIMSGMEKSGKPSAWRVLPGFLELLRNEFVCKQIIDKFRYYPRTFYKNKRLLKVEAVPGCFFIAKVKLLLKYGMFDEDNFLFHEEEILYHKFKRTPYCFIVNKDAQYIHNHIESTNFQGVLKTKKYMIESTLYYLRTYYGYIVRLY